MFWQATWKHGCGVGWQGFVMLSAASLSLGEPVELGSSDFQRAARPRSAGQSRPDERDGNGGCGRGHARFRAIHRSGGSPRTCMRNRKERNGSTAPAPVRRRPDTFGASRPLPVGAAESPQSILFRVSRARDNSRSTSQYLNAEAPRRAMTNTSRDGFRKGLCCLKNSRTIRRTRLRAGAPPTFRLVVTPSRDGSFDFVRVITMKCGAVRRRPSRWRARNSRRLRRR